MLAYWQNYKLNADPFPLEQGNNATFIPSQWKQLLDLVNHLSINSNAVLLITGFSGVGKTTFLKKLNELIGQAAGVCKIQGDESITPDVFRYLLVKHLDIVLTDNRSEVFNQFLAAQLQRMQQNNQRYVLIFDDAHLLPEKTLASILSIATKQPKENSPLHIILFGGPQLEATIADITTQHLGEGITHTSRIKPFTRETTEEYLAFCLAHAGYEGEPLFSEREIDIIYKNSNGIPIKINAFAKQSMEEKILDLNNNEREIQQPMNFGRVWWIAGAITISLVTIVGILMLMKSEKSPSSTEIAINAPQQQKAVVAEADLSDTMVDASADFVAENATEETKTEPQVTHYEESEEGFQEDSESTIPIELNNSKIGYIEDEVLNTNSAEDSKQQESLPQALEDDLEQAMPANKGVRPTVNIATEEQEAINKQSSSTSQEKVSESKPIQDKNIKSKPTLKKQKSVQAYYGNGKELMAANRGHYTMQLMGSYYEAQLKNFVKSAGLEGKVSYFRTYHNGREWYVVVYGHYSSMNAAKAAIASLPVKAQQVKPWVRSFASVQQSIQKTRS